MASRSRRRRRHRRHRSTRRIHAAARAAAAEQQRIVDRRRGRRPSGSGGRRGIASTSSKPSCDTVRPRPGIDGRRWARALDRATDTVLERLRRPGPDRHPHPTSTLRWSVGVDRTVRPPPHQPRDPRPRRTHPHLGDRRTNSTHPTHRPPLTSVGLDAMQAEAAAAVAGHDRLVLVVGPAGAGKTTMLHTAVVDLTHHGRSVFGLAPTAKAARVLETGTGMTSDTVAKLLYEHTRPDRPPRPAWQLPAGTTVDRRRSRHARHRRPPPTHPTRRPTRLAARARSATRTNCTPSAAVACSPNSAPPDAPIELDTIHRFHNDWEAAASLKLRHGDPTGLDAYLDHDRILAAPFAEHLNNIATRLGRRPRARRVPRDHDHHQRSRRRHQPRRPSPPARPIGQLGDRRPRASATPTSLCR